MMLSLISLSLLAVAMAYPAQQILGPTSAIPATGHILILTPQAQVQLEPSVKYSPPLVQHLAPVARIDRPSDQTVVYYPNDNLVNQFQKSDQKPKQIESANLTNIVNQFVAAGQTAQAQLEAFQQQLSQGLENLIQPPGNQKIETNTDTKIIEFQPTTFDQLTESLRQDNGRFYSVPNIPKFISNLEVVHTPVNPLFPVYQYQAIRARSVQHPDDTVIINAPPSLLENLQSNKVAVVLENNEVSSRLQSNVEQARSADILKLSTEQPENESDLKDNQQTQKQLELISNKSNFNEYLSSIENTPSQEKIKKSDSIKERPEELQKNVESVSTAEALPAELAISGKKGLSQTKLVGPAMIGKESVAFSAPVGAATSTTDSGNDGNNIKSS